jgi:hypothetical protein
LPGLYAKNNLLLVKAYPMALEAVTLNINPKLNPHTNMLLIIIIIKYKLIKE